MGGCTGINLVTLKLKHSRWLLKSHGLQPQLLELQNGSTIHCWAPVDSSQSRKPALLLLHGFGGDGMLDWEGQISCLVKRFAVHLPDLLFFGDSTTSNKQRSEFFQAECMWLMMQQLGVQEAFVAGHSYGGFVAFRMAHEYPEFVKRLVIVSSGICMNPETNDPLLEEFGAAKIEEVLLPDSPETMRKTLKFVLNRQLPWIPNFLVRDVYEVIFKRGDRDGKIELIDGIVLGKENAPPLPKVDQEVLIIWGDNDKIFNIELAHQLKELLGSKAELAIIKNAGHVPIMENAKEFNKLLVKFLAR